MCHHRNSGYYMQEDDEVTYEREGRYAERARRSGNWAAGL
jgi:hypothetical protein